MGIFSEAGGDGVVESMGDVLASVEVVGGMVVPLSGSSCKVSFGGDGELEPLPNILFSNPPWEEKLLLCLPASVLNSLLNAYRHGLFAIWRVSEMGAGLEEMLRVGPRQLRVCMFKYDTDYEHPIIPAAGTRMGIADAEARSMM